MRRAISPARHSVWTAACIWVKEAITRKRVVITGMGAITPVGNNVSEYWEALKAGKVGIGPITYFDTANYKATLAAQVKDFNARDYMDPKSARQDEEAFSQFAVAASKEALEQSGIDMTREDPYRVGVSIGSGVGSLQAMERESREAFGKGAVKDQPYDGADDDFQYGCRQCFDTVRLKGEKPEYCYGLHHRHELHRGGLPQYPVW